MCLRRLFTFHIGTFLSWFIPILVFDNVWLFVTKISMNQDRKLLIKQHLCLTSAQVRRGRESRSRFGSCQNQTNTPTKACHPQMPSEGLSDAWLQMAFPLNLAWPRGIAVLGFSGWRAFVCFCLFLSNEWLAEYRWNSTV